MIHTLYDYGALEEEKTALAITQGTENALKAFFGANLFVSFFSAGLLQYLWGLINTLQMIMLTVFFKLNIPVNADTVMIMILKLCALDFFNSEKYIDMLFDFRETDVYDSQLDSVGDETSKFNEAGYESSIFIELLGPVFFIALLTIMILALRSCCKRLFRPCKDNFVRKYLHRKMSYKMFYLRFVMEGCIEFSLCGIISVLMVSD